MAQFAGNAHWAEPSPLYAHRAHPTPLKFKNEYPVLPLGEETAVQAVVGSIVWGFRRLKKPRCREMSARGYALHSVRPELYFFCSFIANEDVDGIMSADEVDGVYWNVIRTVIRCHTVLAH